MFLTKKPRIVKDTEYMFKLPTLPYDKDALSPYISENTLNYHYDKHHAGYVNKLNIALQGHDELLEKSIVELLKDYTSAPADLHGAILNNGGQHYNHSLYWESMSPNGGGTPGGRIREALEEEYGSFEAFKEEFSGAGVSQFGSGWAWLSLDEGGKLIIEKTGNAETPLLYGRTPLLTMDVWEHAYYLDYQNGRVNYIEEFFNVINWAEVERKYVEAKSQLG